MASCAIAVHWAYCHFVAEPDRQPTFAVGETMRDTSDDQGISRVAESEEECSRMLG